MYRMYLGVIWYWTWAFGPIEMPGSFAGSSAGDLQTEVEQRKTVVFVFEG